jgi:dolichol kinase
MVNKMGYITFLEDLPIVWNLIIGAVVALVYIKLTIFIMDKLVSSGKISSDLSRKVIHIAAGSFIWVWLFLDTSDGFSYIFNIVVPFLFFLTFLQKGKSGDPDDADVKTMTRTGDPSELLKGPLYFTVVMMIAGTLFFGSFAGMMMMAIVGWGDGLAPYIGKRYGSRKFKTFGREKTLEGSIGFLLFSILGCLFFYVFFSIGGILGEILSNTTGGILYDPVVGLVEILIVIILCSIVGMIVEALSPADIDNLLIPASTIITLLLVDFFLYQNAAFVVLRILGFEFPI